MADVHLARLRGPAGFWKWVAATFADLSIVLDLYNEPFLYPSYLQNPSQGPLAGTPRGRRTAGRRAVGRRRAQARHTRGALPHSEPKRGARSAARLETTAARAVLALRDPGRW